MREGRAQARSDCLAGTPIDQIGVPQRLANLTLQEGFVSSTTEGREELVSARPGDAVFVMPVEYDAVFDGSKVIRFKQDDSDEIVMDGQDIVLRLTRTRTEKEKKRGGKGDIVQPSWHFLAADVSWVKNMTWANRPALMLTLVPASSILKKFVDKPGLFAPK